MKDLSVPATTIRFHAAAMPLPAQMTVLVDMSSARYWRGEAPFGEPPHAGWYAMQHNMREFRGTLPPDALRDSAFLLQDITL